MRKYLLTISLLVTGCCALGEGTIYLSGTAPVNSNCYLSYHDAAGAAQYKKEAISGDFKSSIMMGGCGGEFFVSAICDGNVIKTYKITSDAIASYDKPYNLGDISP